MLKEWLERNLQDPFFRAEMVKTGINVAEGADQNLRTVSAMAFFGAIYMVFCVFWYAKHI